MRTQLKSRKLRIESLEERTLLAVTAGAEETAAAFIAPTAATTWNVNTLDDPASWDAVDSILSLREALGRAEAGDTINFDATLQDGTITFNGTVLEITKSITIDAASVGGITIDANGLSCVIYNSGGNKTAPTELVSLTITGGNTTDYGGGIINDYYGTLTMTNITVSGNTASSTSSYYSDYYGGGIYNAVYTSTLNIYNSIVVNNSARKGKGGADIYRSSGTVKAYNTLYSDVSGVTLENCYEYDDSLPLFTNPNAGDYTLAADSQAVDLGNDQYALDAGLDPNSVDAAGGSRFCGFAIDLGAYEYQESSAVPLDPPGIISGRNAEYVSCGANRHRIAWNAVENAVGYELAYSSGGGTNWISVPTTETSAVVGGLTYGSEMIYRVRALGSGSFENSAWSPVKVFSVCPMDINGDGDISGADRTVLAGVWLAEEGDENFLAAADINGDGEITGADRSFLSGNWLNEAGEDEMFFPRPKAADAAFAGYEPGGLDVGGDLF